MVLLASAPIAGCGGGDEAQPAGSETALEAPAAAEDLQACLATDHLEVVGADAAGIPAIGPSELNGVEGTPVRGPTGTAAAFAFGSPTEAEDAASLLGGVGRAEGTVVLLADARISPHEQQTIVRCFTESPPR